MKEIKSSVLKITIEHLKGDKAGPPAWLSQ